MAKTNCWICGSDATHKIYDGTVAKLDASRLQVTDAEYGHTLARWQCQQCQFQFCPDADNTAAHYADMVDEEYEETRAPRALQAKKLVQYLYNNNCRGTLLDVGSGSGILLEEATKIGFTAEGLEPSEWLAEIGNKRGNTIYCGTLPHKNIKNKYNAISCIDVVEHVDDPLDLAQQIADLLLPDGKALLVTPDVDSIAARLMGSKWWHYRVAHIGYFNRENFKLALERSGLQIIEIHRPTWYFPASYLLERLAVYLPVLKKLPKPQWLQSIIIPLNLLDSWMVLVEHKND